MLESPIFDTEILECFGLRPYKGDLGLELEAEYSEIKKEFELRPPWKSTRDHSLRGAWPFEFLTCNSVYVDKLPGKFFLENSMKGLLEQVVTPHMDVNSDRTSFHVHVNCQKLTLRQVTVAIACYITVENLLLVHSGEQRATNLYCLGVREAEGYFERSAKILFGRGGDPKSYRYSSLNVYSLIQRGSLEFRSMRGEPNLELLTNWARACHSLVYNSRRYTSFEEIQKALESPEEYLLGLFDEKFAKTLMQIPFWQDSMRESLVALLDWEIALHKAAVKREENKGLPKGVRRPKIDDYVIRDDIIARQRIW